jgi:putative holliday junction resolvase
MGSGRILALDYGTKNVGLACSDELQITVQPLESMPNIGKAHLLSRLRSTVGELGVERIVIGLPLNMDGSEGDAITRVRRFMEELAAEVGIPLHPVDERLSTVEATEIWNQMSPRQKRRYRTVDSLAAALILERYLQESRA